MTRLLKMELYTPEYFLTPLLRVLQDHRTGFNRNGAVYIDYYPVTGCWCPWPGTMTYEEDEGFIEREAEYKIEVIIWEDQLEEILNAIIVLHPYDEPVINVLPFYKDGYGAWLYMQENRKEQMKQKEE